jgi:hypothetical protein
MKVTVITNERGVVAIGHTPAGHVEASDRAGLRAGPGQALHEVEVEEDLLQSRDADALQRRVTELIAQSGR